MKVINYSNRFEKILERLFKGFGFRIESPSLLIANRHHFDLLLERNQSQTIVEIKFYRTKEGANNAVRQAAEQLIDLIWRYQAPVSGLLIISSYTTQAFKGEIYQQYGLRLWDRNDLFNLIKYGLSDSKLLEEFQTLLIEAKQGIDTENVFVDTTIFAGLPSDLFDELLTPVTLKKTKKAEKIKDYCAELKAIPAGLSGWRQYENKCIEILRHLFFEDLENWDTQSTTDDELSRFDMICRIASQNDFWKSLIQSFQSRYVLFEFKNYQNAIGQDQIYTTERYLYLRGLRSVGFIIARVGGSKQAIKAAKGALREHGKLILILTNDDLCKMLEMKKDGKIPSDHLSEILDEFLISLSR
jgi:hypothetical protein